MAVKAPKKIKIDPAQPYAIMAEENGSKQMTLVCGLEKFGPVVVAAHPFGIGDAKIELVKLARTGGITVDAVPLR